MKFQASFKTIHSTGAVANVTDYKTANNDLMSKLNECTVTAIGSTTKEINGKVFSLPWFDDDNEIHYFIRIWNENDEQIQ